MINRYDTWTKLNEVVLGKPNFSLCEQIKDNNDKEFMKDILHELDDTLIAMEKIFKNFNVKVWRPKPFEVKQDTILQTPYQNLTGIYTSIASADNFYTIANAIVEMSSTDPSSIFDYVQYQHIWREKFNDGSRWLSMPRPCHNESNDINVEPLADAPSFQSCGNKIFHSERHVNNEKGLQWFKREFPQFTFIPIKGTMGHLDSYFSIIKPGLILSGLDKKELPNEFANWEVIKLYSENYSDVKIISKNMQDDDFENTILGANTFSIDEENIMIMKHVIDSYSDEMKKIEKHKINIIPIKYDICRWFNQGLNCLCNAINREGKLVNYFE